MNGFVNRLEIASEAGRIITMKIVDFFDECCETGQIYELQFECGTTWGENRDRLLYAEYIINTHKYKDFFKINLPNAEKKDPIESANYREKGNRLAEVGKYFDAIVAYNKSMCFAATAEKLSYRFVNRSVAYFSMERYTNCRKDLIWARECVGGMLPMTERVFEKLTELERTCSEKEYAQVSSSGANASTSASASASTSASASVSPQLHFVPHPNIPYIADCLDIKQVGSKIRIYAKKYITAGTIVIKENLINVITAPQARYEYCHYCVRPSPNLIPCPHCVYAMYCDANCMVRANEEYHNWECAIIDLIYGICDEPMLIAFRIFLKMLNEFKDYEGLRDYWKGVTANVPIDWYSIKSNEFDKRTHFQLFHSNYYKQKYSNEVVFMCSLEAAIFKREILRYSSDLKRIFTNVEQKTLFGEIMIHNLLTTMNLIKYAGGQQYPGNNRGRYAIYFPLIPEMMFKRTNVVRIYRGTKLLWCTAQPIRKNGILRIGEEIEDELMEASGGI